MLTKKRKVDQVKSTKDESKFDSILDQVLSLNTQNKVGKSRSMKNISKAKEAEKTLSPSTISCPYWNESSHT